MNGHEYEAELSGGRTQIICIKAVHPEEFQNQNMSEERNRLLGWLWNDLTLALFIGFAVGLFNQSFVLAIAVSLFIIIVTAVKRKLHHNKFLHKKQTETDAESKES